MIKAVIYDMDDLMVNSDPLHSQAWEVLLERHGHTFKEIPQTVQSQFIGMRVIDTLKEIIAYFKLDVDPDTFYKERSDVFLELVQEKLEALPGLHESLSLFKEHGYAIALASSGAKRYINLVLERFDIASYFDVIISGDDVHKGKPDPETYMIAAQKLTIPPNQCLVLEDATKGIQAAKSAGCKCIAVINLHTAPQDHSNADRIVNSLTEVTIKMVESL